MIDLGDRLRSIHVMVRSNAQRGQSWAKCCILTFLSNLLNTVLFGQKCLNFQKCPARKSTEYYLFSKNIKQAGSVWPKILIPCTWSNFCEVGQKLIIAAVQVTKSTKRNGKCRNVFRCSKISTLGSVRHSLRR
jgi:hypothetical protein